MISYLDGVLWFLGGLITGWMIRTKWPWPPTAKETAREMRARHDFAPLTPEQERANLDAVVRAIHGGRPTQQEGKE